jgi:hypothetical protein
LALWVIEVGRVAELLQVGDLPSQRLAILVGQRRPGSSSSLTLGGLVQALVVIIELGGRRFGWRLFRDDALQSADERYRALPQ